MVFESVTEPEKFVVVKPGTDSKSANILCIYIYAYARENVFQMMYWFIYVHFHLILVFLLLGKGWDQAIAASCHGLPTSGYQITGIANRTVDWALGTTVLTMVDTVDGSALDHLRFPQAVGELQLTSIEFVLTPWKCNVGWFISSIGQLWGQLIVDFATRVRQCDDVATSPTSPWGSLFVVLPRVSFLPLPSGKLT